MNDRKLILSGIFSRPMFRFCGIFFVALLLSCNNHAPQHYEEIKSLHEELDKRDLKIAELADSIWDLSEQITDENLRVAIQRMAGDIGSVFENDEGYIDITLDELENCMFSDAYPDKND